MSIPSESSGLKSADAAICTTQCRVHAVTVLADGTNAATLVLYDNASAASGTVIAKISVKATSTFEWFECDLACVNGVYADVTGTGAEYIVHFSR